MFYALSKEPEILKWQVLHTWCTICISPDTINKICKHMKEKPDKDQSYNLMFYKDHPQYIAGYGNFRMQGMEANTAPVGIKERRCEKMVQVYKHGGHKDKPEF